MHMPRATKKIKWLGGVKSKLKRRYKVEAAWSKQLINNFHSCMDISDLDIKCGSFIFKGNCLILQLKLSLYGMTTTGYPCMVWLQRNIPSWYDHYGISLHGMTPTGYPWMEWLLRNIPMHCMTTTEYPNAWYDHYGISVHGMTTRDIEVMHKIEISDQCLILRFANQFSTSGRFIHRDPCLQLKSYYFWVPLYNSYQLTRWQTVPRSLTIFSTTSKQSSLLDTSIL